MLLYSCDSSHSSNRQMHTSTTITCEATQFAATCSGEILRFRLAKKPSLMKNFVLDMRSAASRDT